MVLPGNSHMTMKYNRNTRTKREHAKRGMFPFWCNKVNKDTMLGIECYEKSILYVPQRGCFV